MERKEVEAPPANSATPSVGTCIDCDNLRNGVLGTLNNNSSVDPVRVVPEALDLYHQFRNCEDGYLRGPLTKALNTVIDAVRVFGFDKVLFIFCLIIQFICFW